MGPNSDPCDRPTTQVKPVKWSLSMYVALPVSMVWVLPLKYEANQMSGTHQINQRGQLYQKLASMLLNYQRLQARF